MFRAIRLAEQCGAMLGERSVLKGLWEADHSYLDPVGPGHVLGSSDVIGGPTVPRR